jgi:hypothetical protein
MGQEISDFHRKYVGISIQKIKYLRIIDILRIFKFLQFVKNSAIFRSVQSLYPAAGIFIILYYIK